jgi:hypothetical protein
MFKRIVMLLCSVLLLTVLPATADEWNKRTKVTFSAPVELPGIVLPAGTYMFKLLDLGSQRHIVRVTNVAEDKVFATLLAIPDWRLTPTADTVMRFEERPRKDTEALKAWFAPGDNFGQEFVYPKKRATELAVSTHQPVLEAEVEPTQEPEVLAKAPVKAVTPEKKEVEVAQARSCTASGGRTSGTAACNSCIAGHGKFVALDLFHGHRCAGPGWSGASNC